MQEAGVSPMLDANSFPFVLFVRTRDIVTNNTPNERFLEPKFFLGTAVKKKRRGAIA